MVIINGIKANFDDLQKLFDNCNSNKTKILFIRKTKNFINIITD